MLKVRMPELLRTSLLRGIRYSRWEKEDSVAGRIRAPAFKSSTNILAYPKPSWHDDFDKAGKYYSKPKRLFISGRVTGRVKRDLPILNHTQDRFFKYKPRIPWESNMAFLDQFDYVFEIEHEDDS